MLTVEQAEQWAQDLESGQYVQCTYKMIYQGHTFTNHCSLDILTRFSVPSIPEGAQYIYPSQLMPPLLSKTWTSYFIRLNDIEDLTFFDIARHIRTYLIPSLVDSLTHYSIQDY